MMKHDCIQVFITVFSLLLLYLEITIIKHLSQIQWIFLLLSLMYDIQKLVYTRDKMRVLRPEKERERE